MWNMKCMTSVTIFSRKYLYCRCISMVERMIIVVMHMEPPSLRTGNSLLHVWMGRAAVFPCIRLCTRATRLRGMEVPRTNTLFHTHTHTRAHSRCSWHRCHSYAMLCDMGFNETQHTHTHTYAWMASVVKWLSNKQQTNRYVLCLTSIRTELKYSNTIFLCRCTMCCCLVGYIVLLETVHSRHRTWAASVRSKFFFGFICRKIEENSFSFDRNYKESNKYYTDNAPKVQQKIHNIIYNWSGI